MVRISRAEIRVMLAELSGLTPPLLSLCGQLEAPRCAAWLWLWKVLISLSCCLYPLCSLDFEVFWEFPVSHRRNMKACLTQTHTPLADSPIGCVITRMKSCLKVWKEVACRGAQNITKWNYFKIFLAQKSSFFCLPSRGLDAAELRRFGLLNLGFNLTKNNKREKYW